MKVRFWGGIATGFDPLVPPYYAAYVEKAYDFFIYLTKDCQYATFTGNSIDPVAPLSLNYIPGEVA